MVELDETPDAEIVKVAIVLPAATVTLAGTDATVLSALERVTNAPDVGAGELNVTVAVEVPPDTTEVGLSVKFEIEPELVAGVTVRVAVCCP